MHTKLIGLYIPTQAKYKQNHQNQNKTRTIAPCFGILGRCAPTSDVDFVKPMPAFPRGGWGPWRMAAGRRALSRSLALGPGWGSTERSLGREHCLRTLSPYM